VGRSISLMLGIKFPPSSQSSTCIRLPAARSSDNIFRLIGCSWPDFEDHIPASDAQTITPEHAAQQASFSIWYRGSTSSWGSALGASGIVTAVFRAIKPVRATIHGPGRYPGSSTIYLHSPRAVGKAWAERRSTFRMGWTFKGWFLRVFSIRTADCETANPFAFCSADLL
jgi:hypothetical protein